MGDRIKEEREARGWSQQELAGRAGVSQGTIGNLEAGLRKSARALIEIAAALEVRPEWLASGKGDKHGVAHLVAKEPSPHYGGPAPKPPPKDFTDRHEVSDSDWALLQDLHDAMASPSKARQLEQILSEVREERAHYKAQFEQRLAEIQAGGGGNAGGMSIFGELDEVPAPAEKKRKGGAR